VVTRLWSTAAACLVFAGLPRAAGQEPGAALPDRLETYFSSTVKLTADERKRLFDGAPITKLLETDESKEVAVLGAIWINAPIGRYIAAVKDIERFESGGAFRMTKRISDPPAFEDFSGMRLSPEDLRDLRSCRVGDCEVKLSEQGLQRFRSEVDWNAPDPAPAVNAVLQKLAFEYVTRYLKGGNAELAVYRDGSRPTFVADEFRAIVDRMPELTSYLPNLHRYLLEYPKATLPNATSFLYWQETEFGLKPTIRISHLTIAQTPEGAVVASKMLYASHYFWTGLELRVLTPAPGRGGFWFVTVNRSRSDGLSGFTGLFVRRRVRSEVQSGTLVALRSTKQAMER
jgi:hypothetical protein